MNKGAKLRTVTALKIHLLLLINLMIFSSTAYGNRYWDALNQFRSNQPLNRIKANDEQRFSIDPPSAERRVVSLCDLRR